MVKNIAFCIFVLSISSFANADSSRQVECLAELKERILNKNISFGDENIIEDDWYVEKFNELKNQNTSVQLSKDSVDDTVHKLSAQFSNAYGASITFNLSYSDGEDFLGIDLESANKSRSIEKTFSVEEDCSLNYISLDIKEIEYGTTNSITTIYHNKINELDTSSIAFTGELINPQDYLDKTTSGEGKIQKKGFTYEEGQIVPLDLNLSWDSNGEFNLSVNYGGLYSLEGYGKTINSKLDYLQITSPFSLKIEVLSETEFFNASLEGLDQLITFDNLPEDFYYASGSILEVTTNNSVNTDLLKNYFKYTEVSPGTYKLSHSLNSFSKETALMTDSILIEDKKYLIGSDYIQTNHPEIQKYKNEIESMKLKTRAEVIQAVQKLVTNVIEYDYEMIDNDVTRVLHLDDFLTKGKGVCQHFALLSTTLLRALGIPARIIVGYSLSPNTAGGHAWIEAKITNDYWLPIEPQNQEDYAIWTLNYYPLGVMTDYEKGNPLITDKTNELTGFTSKYIFKNGNL